MTAPAATCRNKGCSCHRPGQRLNHLCCMKCTGFLGGPTQPRRHSRDGSVRCDLCAPLRCSKAR